MTTTHNLHNTFQERDHISLDIINQLGCVEEQRPHDRQTDLRSYIQAQHKDQSGPYAQVSSLIWCVFLAKARGKLVVPQRAGQVRCVSVCVIFMLMSHQYKTRLSFTLDSAEFWLAWDSFWHPTPMNHIPVRRWPRRLIHYTATSLETSQFDRNATRSASPCSAYTYPPTEMIWEWMIFRKNEIQLQCKVNLNYHYSTSNLKN